MGKVRSDGTTTDENTPPVEDGNTPPAEGEETPNPEGGEGNTPDSGGEGGSEDKTLTQDEANAIVQKRLKRAREKWEEEQAEAARKAKLSAEEKAREEKAEAERAANERVAKANERIIRADAKGVAAEIGVKPERVSAVLDLADLSEVEVSDETNEADPTEIRTALTAVLEKFPEFRKPEYGTAPGNRNVAEGGAPTGIDAEIQEALDKGNYIKAERLRAAKLAKEGKLKHPE